MKLKSLENNCRNMKTKKMKLLHQVLDEVWNGTVTVHIPPMLRVFDSK